MFFVFGIANGEKKLNFVQTIVCQRCGQFGRWEAYVTYMYFSLFFIPVFRWSKHFYIKSSCCGAIYEIDKELGKRIQRGEEITLNESELHIMNGQSNQRSSSCPRCGYSISTEFEYCPKCGHKL